MRPTWFERSPVFCDGNCEFCREGLQNNERVSQQIQSERGFYPIKKCKIKTKQWNTRKFWELLSMSVEVEIRTMNLQEKCENFTSCFLILVRQLFWKEYFQPQLFWLDRQGRVAGLWETEILRMCIWKSDSRREQSINHHIDFLRLL